MIYPTIGMPGELTGVDLKSDLSVLSRSGSSLYYTLHFQLI